MQNNDDIVRITSRVIAGMVSDPLCLCHRDDPQVYCPSRGKGIVIVRYGDGKKFKIEVTQVAEPGG